MRQEGKRLGPGGALGSEARDGARGQTGFRRRPERRLSFVLFVVVAVSFLAGYALGGHQLTETACAVCGQPLDCKPAVHQTCHTRRAQALSERVGHLEAELWGVPQ